MEDAAEQQVDDQRPFTTIPIGHKPEEDLRRKISVAVVQPGTSMNLTAPKERKSKVRVTAFV